MPFALTPRIAAELVFHEAIVREAYQDVVGVWTWSVGVDEVFAGFALTEAQIGAALSFHYNTGGLRRASWAKQWKAGDVAKARKSFLTWNKPPQIVGRRKAECALFFDGIWANDGTATEFPVDRTTHRPRYRHGQTVAIGPILEELFG
ncbi:MAG: hypothetical protein R3F61_36460 [Myxococcota bacterium]